MTREPADPPEVLARVQEGLTLVEIIARQLARRLPPHIDVGELVSLGHEGLLSAARSFDPERGVPFRRWANLRVRGAMIDGVRAMGTLPRRVYKELRAIKAGDRVANELHEEDAAAPPDGLERADARLSVYLSGMATAMALGLLAGSKRDEAAETADEATSPEDLFARRELVDQVRAAIAELPEAERRLLERHYFDDVTFEDAARELGLSKSWGSRLHARAIESVARDLRRRKIR